MAHLVSLSREPKFLEGDQKGGAEREAGHGAGLVPTRDGGVYLQGQADDAGRVGQHAVQDVQQGAQQRACHLGVVFVVHVQAQGDRFGEQVTDMMDQS